MKQSFCWTAQDKVTKVEASFITATSPCLRSSVELSLVVGDSLDLGSRGTLGVEAVVEPVTGELLGELNTDDTLTHAQDLGVVAQDGALNGERVVSSDGTDAGHLVGGDGNTQTGAADEQTTVSLALLDELGTLDGRVGVGSLVGGGVDTDVGDGLDERVLLQLGLDGVLVRNTGLVAGHDDAEGLEIGRHCEVEVYLR